MIYKANTELLKVGDVIYTENVNGGEELAIVTRIEEPQIYGEFLTGPHVDSRNQAGEPNEFLLRPAAGELAS